MVISKCKKSLLSLFVLSIVGCGGGDNPNEPPVLSQSNSAFLDERSSATLSITASDNDGSISSYSWKQASGPSVEFDGSLSTISFLVPDVEEDTGISFTVTVTDNDGASAQATVSSTIKDINRAPEITSRNFAVEFNQATEIAIAAVDADEDELTFGIDAAPAYGEVTITDNSNLVLLYTPDENSISADAFTISISDGIDTSTQVIDVDIVDTSAPVVTSYSPSNDDVRIAMESELTVTFDDVMGEIASSEEGACAGAFQLSRNNFSSCIAIEVSSSDTRNFTLKPNDNGSGGMWPEQTYQLRVTALASNFYGVPAEPQTITSFNTELPNLIITEFSSSYYSDDNRWVELYNGTANDRNLSDYALHTGSIDLDLFERAGSQIFPLPDKTIKSGEYIILQGRFGNGYWQSSTEESEQLVLVGSADDNVRPAWSTDGFIELLTSNQRFTADFVRFGDSEQLPVSSHAWDASRSLRTVGNILGTSMARNLQHLDSNVPEDWSVAKFMTPGGPNDVNDCFDDADLDGIPDCAEAEGKTFAGLPLYEWGARVNQKDIFIEVDYMESDDPGVIPHQIALEKVQDSFDKKVTKCILMLEIFIIHRR